MNELKESRQKEKKIMDNCKLCSCKSDYRTCNRHCKLNVMGEILEVKRLTKNATIPKRGIEGVARYDLSSVVDIVMLAHSRCVVKTGLSFRLPR